MRRTPTAAVLLAATIIAAFAGSAFADPHIKTFMHVKVTPVGKASTPPLIANKFCLGQGFQKAGAHLFIGFEEADGSVAALFRQITCSN